MMARNQTVFSELCIARNLTHDKSLESVHGVQHQDKLQFYTEEQKRLATASGRSSVGVLEETSKAIHTFLSTQGLLNQSVHWLGKHTTEAGMTVAKDIQVADWRISVKENAHVFINGSTLTVFEDIPMGGLGRKRHGSDWFSTVAAEAYQDYFYACQRYTQGFSSHASVQDFYARTSKQERKAFSVAVAELHKKPSHDISELSSLYLTFCHQVSQQSAQYFNHRLAYASTGHPQEKLMSVLYHYFFKLNGSKYILAGSDHKKPFAVLVPSSSEWQTNYMLHDVKAIPKYSGQPEVILRFFLQDLVTQELFELDLKVEVRWSHGKFCGNPEAKVYKQWLYSDLPWVTSLL
ncbi:MAG: hypothetical protein ACKO37_02520 [Vampirovibrionales bacterium]